MSASIKIGRIFGIPIYLHLTFLLILPLFVLLFSAPDSNKVLGFELSFGALDTQPWVRYVFGTIGAVLFFVAILVHELAHSYLAQRYGVKIKGITLMIFGGVSSMEEMPRKPGQEWRMAFAGPLSSLAIGVGSYLVMLVLEVFQPGSVLLEGMIILVGLMAFYNIVLAGFNLIPAFPMDGGRLLRAYFATRMSYLEATRRAARIGRYFAIAMGVFGIFYNFFFILIALFVYIGATEEEQSTTITESLHGVQVRNLMSQQVQVVNPEMPVPQLHDLMLRTGYMGFPVVDQALVGIVTLSDTHKVSKDAYAHARVRDIMTKSVVTVPPEMDAAKALYLMSERRLGRLVVTEGSQIVGIVTRKDFLRAIDMASVKRQTMRWGEQFQQTAQPPPPV
jgi:Zn-dependent protease